MWYSRRLEKWYLSTWSPRHYVIPLSADMVKLCMECLSHGDVALGHLPAQIISRFGLAEIPYAEFDSLYDNESNDAAGT
jgi:hypothetical protein